MSALPRDAHSIQKEFDDLHEEIYKKGGIRPTNAAIDEVCKLIFLKLHTECCPDYRLQSGAAAAKNFTDIFHGAYIRRHGKLAVREMQDAFREISILPRYTMTINEGDVQTIFSYQEPLRLDHPDVLAKAIDILSHVKLSVSDDHLVNETQRRWEVFTHYDILGSAFDVFLRGRYDSAGGLSTHLTPIQVVDAMVDMAFNHVTDSQLWSSRDGASGEPNLPNFLIGDITCGTGRFLIRALAEVRDRILNTPNKENEEKLLWLSKVKGYSFFGADQSAASILKARINFLMFGEPHARLLTVEDSILDHYIDQLVGMFDIILTNPPFGEGKYETRLGLEKMRQEGLGLQLGWSWKPNNHSKTALRRADPALLFLDRNL